MKKFRCLMVIVTACVMAFTLIPVTAGAATKYTHTFSYDLRGGSPAIAPFKVKDNKYFTISKRIPSRNYYKEFEGYYAYRVSDKKFYVPGKGWKKSSRGAKLYKPGQTFKLDKSWRKGNKKSNYMLIAKYSRHFHYVYIHDQLYGTGLDSIRWENHVESNQSFYLPGKLGNKGNKVFKGWKLYRSADKKYYVAGVGWLKKAVIKSDGYTPKVYAAESRVRLDSSWTRGCSAWSNYVFIPVWEVPNSNSGSDVRVPEMNNERGWLW